MHELPRQKLKLIIVRYGVSLHEDPKRCEAFLRDFCGQYRKEISLLINAQKEKIPAELLNSKNSSLPVSLTIARLSKRLEDNLAITAEAAKWSVESWALALNVTTVPEKTILEKTVTPYRFPSPPNNNSERKISPQPPVKTQYRRENIDRQQTPSIDQNKKYFEEGNNYYIRGNYQAAIENFDRVLKINPNNVEVCFKHGFANFCLDNYLETIEDCDHAISLNPDYTDAYICRGFGYFGRGNNYQALQEFNQALKLNSQHIVAYIGLSLTNVCLGNHQQAVADLKKIRSIAANFNRDLYNQFAGITSNFDSNQYNQVLAHLVQGKRQEAIDYLKKTAKLYWECHTF